MRERLADGRGVDAAGEADGRGRHRVLAVVRAAQADLGGRHQRLAAPEQRAVAVGEVGRAVADATASHTTRSSTRSRHAAPPASSSASAAGTTASVPGGWWAKISSFAAR